MGNRSGLTAFAASIAFALVASQGSANAQEAAVFPLGDLFASHFRTPLAGLRLQDEEPKTFARGVYDTLEANTHDPRLSIAYDYEAVKYTNLDIRPNGGAKSSFGNQKRWTHGLEFAWGCELARGFVELTDDEFQGSYGDRAKLDVTGAIAGIKGSPTIWGNRKVCVFVPWEASYGFHRLELKQSAVSSQLSYVEFGGKIGLGVDVMHVRLSGGFGISRFSDPPGAFNTATFAVVTGTNNYEFASLEWRVPDFLPLTLRADALFGDIRGFGFSVGWRF